MTYLQILTLLLVAVIMGLTLAHALEFPGKLRLSKEQYFAVQTIYYPGFTLGGLIGEFGGMIALAATAFLVPYGSREFWWLALALALMLASHATYWLVTHPVNKVWTRHIDMRKPGSTFFGAGHGVDQADWKALRQRWEYSHVARAVLFIAAFIAAAMSLA